MKTRFPQSLLAESASIGAAIQDPTLVGDLQPSLFFDERHRTLAEILIDLSAKGRPIDATALSMRADVHLLSTIAACVDACHSPAHFPAWRETLETKARLREALQFHGAARSRIEALGPTASEEEERALLANLESEFVALGRERGASGLDLGVAEAVDELVGHLDSATPTEWLRTGLSALDRFLRVRPGQLLVVAARPSVGKSALAGRIVETVALDQGRSAGWFSLEMTRTEILQRMASGLSGVPFEDFEHPRPGQQERIVEALGRIKQCPLRLCDQGGLTIGQLASQARRWKVRHGVELLVVDYLGLIRPDCRARSRYEAVTEISAALKQLARDLDLTLLVLAQLNRQAAGSAEGEDGPRLHHLRDSGSIEQDADAVVLLHATGCAGPLRQITAAIEKQRNGPLGEARLTLHGPTMRFESASPIDPADVPAR